MQSQSTKMCEKSHLKKINKINKLIMWIYKGCNFSYTFVLILCKSQCEKNCITCYSRKFLFGIIKFLKIQLNKFKIYIHTQRKILPQLPAAWTHLWCIGTIFFIPLFFSDVNKYYKTLSAIFLSRRKRAGMRK